MGRLNKLKFDQVTVDSRLISSQKTIFFAIGRGAEYIADAFRRGAKYVVAEVAETVLNNVIYVEDALRTLQELAHYHRRCNGSKVIAITGSKGKTIVKDLLRDMLKTTYKVHASPESFNSQIGVPLSIFGIFKDDQYAVIEAGVSFKGEMSILADIIDPDCVIITNIMKNHSATLQNVLSEKSILATKGAKKEWILRPPEIININDSKSWDLESKLVYVEDRVRYTIYIEGNAITGSVLKQYAFLIDNIKIAAHAAFLEGVSCENIQRVIDRYCFESNRTEFWRSPLGVTYINEPYFYDSFSFGASFAKLKDVYVNGRKIFFYHSNGIDITHIDYNYLLNLMEEYKIDFLILDDPRLFEYIKENNFKFETIYVASVNEGLQQIMHISRRGDFVLIKGFRKISLQYISDNFSGIIGDSHLHVDLEAIYDNITKVKEYTGCSVMPMLKASAYGTDSAMLGRYLQCRGVDIIGVAYVNEAVKLREEGFYKDILVLYASIKDLSQIFKYSLQVAVSESKMIDELAKASSKAQRTLKLHLDVDTGMGRLGCRLEDALELAQKIKSAEYLELEGLMTHFAAADDSLKDGFTDRQRKSFEELSKAVKTRWYHCANSSASMRIKVNYANMVRIGLAMYGVYPSAECCERLPLSPTLSLRSRIIQIKQCFKGENISYGCNYTVQAETENIALIPMGYFDGISRRYTSQMEVLINGCRAPVVGAICMDFMMINVSGINGVKVGDEIVVFGYDDYGNYISPEEFALLGGDISYELLTSIGPRVQRIFYS